MAGVVVAAAAVTVRDVVVAAAGDGARRGRQRRRRVVPRARKDTELGQVAQVTLKMKQSGIETRAKQTSRTLAQP